MLKNLKGFMKNNIASVYYFRNQNTSIVEVKEGAISYVEGNRLEASHYRFSNSAKGNTLFSSVYAILIYGLTSTKIANEEEWKTYFDSCQCDDGIWRDPCYQFRNWNMRGCEWNDIHIIPHIIYGYEKLNTIPKKEFCFLEKFLDMDYVYSFCSKIDFEKFWGESNGVMNYLVSMMYARDHLGRLEYDRAIKYIISFLRCRMDETGGLFTEKRDKKSLFEAVRGGYHVWMLMIQEGEIFNQTQIKNIIDSILLLQNRFGGFNDEIIADTCHNIDCIDPLVRFSFMIPNYRKKEVENTLRKAKRYLLNNRNSDGGFCFNRMSKFRYGNDAHVSKRNESNMFATWFSLLALLIIEDYFNKDAILVSKLPGMEYVIKK